MTQAEQYINALFKRNSIVVSEKKRALFEEFINSDSTNRLVNEISDNQQALMENWKIQNSTHEIAAYSLRIPNATEGKPYHVVLDINSLNRLGLVAFEIGGLTDFGLSFDKEKNTIEGIPQKSGDINIKMLFRVKGETENQLLHVKLITLVVNPNPRNLWKNIETPLDIKYYKPDSNKEFDGKDHEKTMIAASQRGRSHALEGKPRDDDFALLFDETTRWHIMTVADGAGSAKFSRKGSEIACKTVVDICQSKISELGEHLEKQIISYQEAETVENRKSVGDSLYHIVGVAAFQAYKAIEKEAQEANNPVKDYATTLIISICRKFDFGWFVGAFWVGDGGIGIYRQEPEYLKVLGEPDGGEFAGQTRFLTMPEIFAGENFYKRLRFDIIDDFTALILMTDGVTDPKFETDANLNRIEKWQELWRDLNGENEDNAKVDFTDNNEQSAEQLLKWLDFWSKGNHDDRTIAVLF